MNTTLEKLGQVMNQMTVEEYGLIAISLLFIFILFYIYFLSKEKNKLGKTIENNLKVFQKAVDISDDAVLILSAKNEVMYANSTMVRLLQLNNNFLLKTFESTVQIKVKKDWIALDQFIEDNRTGPKRKVCSYPKSVLKISEGDEIPVNIYLDTIVMRMPVEVLCDVIYIQDLTKEKERSGTHFKHQLTNLPNQLQAYHDLPAFFSKAHLEKNKLALMLLHLDNFSMLRSIIGYEQANAVLKKFANYLETLGISLNVSIYHTFDNHFLLTVTNLHSIEEARTFVEDIQKQLASFYKIEDVNLHLTVSAGIAIYPDSGAIRKLLDHAYKALSEAEKEGDGKITIFLPEKFNTNYDELRLHSDMPSALSKGEFEVYYQPIIQVENQEVVAAEALIRWKHPQYGLIPPDVFISLMERTGFIIKLGQYVLEEVLKQQKRWELFKFKQIEVSINVSMVEINTGRFVHHVERKLGEHQINPELIKFEITEGIAMLNESETVKDFLALKKLGVGISLDDFGTGYTSFGYLKKFPADNVKIDKSLVDYILTNEEDQRIVKAIIELAHTLGMKIVVEGIENQKMVDMIASYGCDYMQGYHFSKPLPVFEFQKLLR
ncbi:MAG: bifunctional diguanylate cyclase/phosphodiesterase [Sulfurovum sp.]|uniref:putative bifunctional diguanylate cyclase/phosphodiesterase n=1 Tax=Sulfurovum sp. TaxID=1969726 RepID=UPI0028681AFC|nr:bifunctional diguanylate cyclase/phosphodiesterase [Sulfurovum sp.]MCO4844834.1 bifunctional diguanylate cyclase/phosphodiesterase [Sulfurovum sp.]